jgi:L-arabinokinase
MMAMCTLWGVQLDAMMLATACQAVENQVCGAPCGVMDQVTAAAGRADAMLELLCQPAPDRPEVPAQVVGHVAIPDGFRLVGIYSGVDHDVSGDPYTDTRVAAFMARRILATSQPADPTEGWLANLGRGDLEHYRRTLAPVLPEHIRGAAFLADYGETGDPVTTVNPDKVYTVRAAAEHHVMEMWRVAKFTDLMRRATAGQVEAMARRAAPERDALIHDAGRLMYESHRSYGQCANLGHPATDALVDLVRDAGPDRGLYGAKITGGGSGGTVAVLLRDGDEAQEALQHLCRNYARQTGHDTLLFDGSGPGATAVGTQTMDLEGL